MGKVILVGAGPGDAGLITVRGLETLKQCDAVVYDRLAAEELLDAVPADCARIYVGKRPGAHTRTQEEINRILVECAGKYACVVRLKGGDPFVFGRGGEEAMALLDAGIPFEVVPGVTSAVAVPELAGIPVTHRGIARSFHVITGHTGTEDVSTAESAAGADSARTDGKALAASDGTLVVLMGIANLEAIAGELMRHGKASDTPAAVIADGATPRMRVVRGTLSDIAEKVRAAQIAPPAVLVIGPCAALQLVEEKPPVYAVGTAETLAAFRREMEALGGAVRPLIEMRAQPAEGRPQLVREIDRIAEYDWILFASRQAVEQFFSAYREAGADIRAVGGCRFGVIGKGTAAALREHDIFADFMPKEAEAEQFAQEFVRRFGADKPRVLLPRAVRGNPRLAEILLAAGCVVCEAAVYDVEPRRTGALPESAESAGIAFFSASGVDAFFAARETGGRLPERCRFYCIGERTKDALREKLSAYREAECISGAQQETGRQRVRIVTAEEPTAAALAQKVMETEREETDEPIEKTAGQ